MDVPAALKIFRSQIMINPATIAMIASFMEERIYEALSKSDKP